MWRRGSISLPWCLDDAIQVLAENEARVEYSDEFVSPAGKRTRRPALGGYSLAWTHGAMQLDSKERADALREAALVITLWLCGVDVGDAHHVARATIRTWDVHMDEGVLCFELRDSETKT